VFDLKVVGLDEAVSLVREDWPTRIVSLTGDAELYYGPHHLHIQVNDVSFIAQHLIHPMPEHLHQILAFTKDLTAADRLLVHCFAGQSRSTAVAIGILIDHGMSYREAFDHVASVRGLLLPNQLFIQHIDEHFALQGALVDHVAAHRKANIGDMIIAGPPSEEAITDMKKLLQMFRL
jgi:predicted protein tyrosine phosphatase